MEIDLLKSVDEWKSFEFVRYFYMECDKAYKREAVWKPTDIGKKSADCMRMKRILSLFDLYKKTKVDIKKFLDHSIAIYLSENHAIPIDIAYLSCTVRDYLNIPKKQRRKHKKREKVVLSEETKKWLMEEKAKERKKAKDAKRTTK